MEYILFGMSFVFSCHELVRFSGKVIKVLVAASIVCDFSII